MDSAVNPKPVYANSVLSARADDQLTHAYETIKSADEQIARVSEQLSKLEQDDARKLEQDDARRRQLRGRPALRGLIGLVLAAVICGAALLSRSSYGEAARLMIEGWLPVRAAASTQPQAEPVAPAQPGPVADQRAEADPAPPQPALAAQANPEAAVPAAAPLSPELTELLQQMARDLATLQQGIEQLKAGQEQMKASQEQMARDHAALADALKANQEQMARLVTPTVDKSAAKTPDQASGPNVRRQATAAPAPAPRPPVAAVRKPVPATPPSPHAAARRPAPIQLESAEQ
jgi:hypothetical protein